MSDLQIGIFLALLVSQVLLTAIIAVNLETIKLLLKSIGEDTWGLRKRSHHGG